MDMTLLSPKHSGMKADIYGVLGRVAEGKGAPRADQRYMIGELLRHLEETAAAFYQGDKTAADRFFQTWCLDEKRPKN